MMKKLKKLMVVCLMVVMCLGNTFMVNAEERGVLPSGEIIEIKEILDENSEINSRKISKSGEFALGSNENYFSVYFTPSNFPYDPHTTFTLKVSNVSGGQWYAVIKGSDGYSYTSSNFSGGATITTTNLQKDVTYEVSMYWVIGTRAVKGYYTMDSGY